jgi:orotate phosphoribosyltransferase
MSLADLTFINHKQLLADMLAWERHLPKVDAFIGVPRSGLLVSSFLALRRNVRHIPLGLLKADPTNCIARCPLRDNNPAMIKGKHLKPITGNVMVVDDCVSQNAHTLKQLRAAFKDHPLNIYYGAVYRAEETKAVDFFYKEVPQPRMFEWNFFRHWNMHKTMWDMDGAICDDWAGKKEKFAQTEYQKHLGNAKPLYIPEHPILAVCTNRLSRWRPQTRNWLQRHDVKYVELEMSPYPDHDARDAGDNPRGQNKGYLYKKDPEAELFVESDIRQSRVIREISGKPVLSIDEMVLL